MMGRGEGKGKDATTTGIRSIGVYSPYGGLLRVRDSPCSGVAVARLLRLDSGGLFVLFCVFCHGFLVFQVRASSRFQSTSRLLLLRFFAFPIF